VPVPEITCPAGDTPKHRPLGVGRLPAGGSAAGFNQENDGGRVDRRLCDAGATAARSQHQQRRDARAEFHSLPVSVARPPTVCFGVAIAAVFWGCPTLSRTEERSMSRAEASCRRQQLALRLGRPRPLPARYFNLPAADIDRSSVPDNVGHPQNNGGEGDSEHQRGPSDGDGNLWTPPRGTRGAAGAGSGCGGSASHRRRPPGPVVFLVETGSRFRRLEGGHHPNGAVACVSPAGT